MKEKLLSAIIFTVFSFFPIFGQQTGAGTVMPEWESMEQQRRINESEERMKRTAQEQKRSLEKWVIDSMAREHTRKMQKDKMLSAEAKAIRVALDPAPEDLAEYKTFLEQPNTGLFRLLPNFNCSDLRVVSAEDLCARSTFFGEYYSFREKNYSSKDFHDLTFKGGNLISSGYLSQAILTNLGDVPLENVSVESDQVKFLVRYKPETTIEKTKEQLKALDGGIKIGDHRYSKSAEAMPMNTYALRVIAYQGKNDFSGTLLTTEHMEFWMLKGDERVDLTVAFRVVRVDREDGGLIILWKQLVKNKAPKIVVDKKAGAARLDD